MRKQEDIKVNWSQSQPSPQPTPSRRKAHCRERCIQTESVDSKVTGLPLPLSLTAAINTLLRELMVVILHDDLSVAEQYGSKRLVGRVPSSDVDTRRVLTSVVQGVLSLKRRVQCSEADAVRLVHKIELFDKTQAAKHTEQRDVVRANIVSPKFKFTTKIPTAPNPPVDSWRVEQLNVASINAVSPSHANHLLSNTSTSTSTLRGDKEMAAYLEWKGDFVKQLEQQRTPT